MKNLYRILIALLAFSFIAVSCKDKEYEYIPGEPEASGCYGVYFPTQDASGSHTYDPTMERSVTITVSRTNSTGAITVPYVATSSEDGIFNFGTINFADGQTETELLVTFPNAKVGVDYSFSVQIDDKQYASLYNEGAIALDFSVLIVEMKTLKDEKGNPTKVKFYVNNDFLGDFGISDPYELEGTIEYYEVNGVRYGTVVPDQGGIWLSDAVIKFIWYPNQEIEYDGKTYQLVEVPVGNTGYELPGSEVGADHPCAVLFSDYYHHYSDIKGNDLGTYLEFAAKYGQSYKLSYYDGHGGFYFNLVYDIEGTSYWYGFCEGTVVGIANGYTRVDYTLNLDTDYTIDGVAPVYVKTGVDIAKIKYAAFEGELTATQIGYKVADLTSGAETGEEYSGMVLDEEDGYKYGAFGVSPATSGTYTLVAIAFDEKGAVKNSASVVLNYIAAGDNEKYAVDVHVGTEAVSSRYEHLGYNDINAIGYYIFGSGLTVVRYAIVKTEDYAEDPDGINASVKASGTAVSEAVLAQINGAGGYASIATGLNPLTDYTVVVYAANGDLDKFVTATRSTDGLPRVQIAVGTYTYDAWWGGEDPEQPLFKDPNYDGLYILPNWGGGVDFPFTMDDKGVITINTFYIGSSHSDYGPVYYVDPFEYYSEAALAADESKAVHSYYDAETNTYNFHFVLAVSAGSFGHFWESYKVTSVVTPSASTILSSVIAKAMKSVPTYEKGCKFSVPSSQDLSYERDPQSVKVSVSEINNRENTYVRPSVHKSEKFSVK